MTSQVASYADVFTMLATTASPGPTEGAFTNIALMSLTTNVGDPDLWRFVSIGLFVSTTVVDSVLVTLHSAQHSRNVFTVVRIAVQRIVTYSSPDIVVEDLNMSLDKVFRVLVSVNRTGKFHNVWNEREKSDYHFTVYVG